MGAAGLPASADSVEILSRARNDHGAAGVIRDAAGLRKRLEQRDFARGLDYHWSLHRSDYRDRLAVLLFQRHRDLRSRYQSVRLQQFGELILQLVRRESRGSHFCRHER